MPRIPKHNKQQDSIEKQPPTMPNWLSDDAKKCWRQLVNQMKEQIAKCDEGMLASYCEAYATMKQASLLLQADGLTQSVNGRIYIHPAVGVLASAKQQLLSCAKQLGCSPLARQHMTISEQEEDNKWKEFE